MSMSNDDEMRMTDSQKLKWTFTTQCVLVRARLMFPFAIETR